MAGRVNISPSASGPSSTSNSAAIAFACSSLKLTSRRLREGEKSEAVAARADFGIDLEAALNRCHVVAPEDAVERPALVRQGDALRRDGGRPRRNQAEADDGGAGRNDEATHHAFSIFCAAAPPGAGPPPFNTEPAMLSGSGLVRSSLPSSGMMTMK